MKISNVALVIGSLFLFSSTSLFAQGNQGGNGMEYMYSSGTYSLDCEETPGLEIPVEFYSRYKQTPSGLTIHNWRVSGEGLDENGVLWKMNYVTANRIDEDFNSQGIINIALIGSNGHVIHVFAIQRKVEGEVTFGFELASGCS